MSLIKLRKLANLCRLFPNDVTAHCLSEGDYNYIHACARSQDTFSTSLYSETTL